MALRIRKSGEIVCAAVNEAENGDVYVHDGWHELLTGCCGFHKLHEKLWTDDEGDSWIYCDGPEALRKLVTSVSIEVYLMKAPRSGSSIGRALDR